MKVLITGGAGYIGSILTEHLLARGDQVHAIDSLDHGDHSLFQFCANKNYQFTKGDARRQIPGEDADKSRGNGSDCANDRRCIFGAHSISSA